jgi:hypothetical protein
VSEAIPSIFVSDRKVALLGKVKRLSGWALLALLIVFRSSGYSVTVAAGACLAVGILASAIAMLYAQTSQHRSQKRVSVDSVAVADNLGARILLAGICALFPLLPEVYPYALKYFVAAISATGIAIRVVQLLAQVVTRDIEKYLGLHTINDVLLLGILFVFGYGILVGPTSGSISGISLTVWAASYVTLLRAYALYMAWPRNHINRRIG